MITQNKMNKMKERHYKFILFSVIMVQRLKAVQLLSWQQCCQHGVLHCFLLETATETTGT